MGVPRYAILILMGLSLYAFYQVFPEKLAPGMEDTPDKILPYFIMTQVPVGLCGLIVAAIFAAAMSSFDSGLNCLTAVFVVDWYKRIINPGQDDKKYLFVAKLLTVLLGIAITILGIVIYKSGIKSIVDSSNKYLGFFFGPMVGIFLLGIFTRRAKPLSVLIASVVSFVLVLTLDIVNMKLGAGEQIINIYFYGPIAIIGTVVIGYVGSLFGPELPYENIREFTVAKKKAT
jgi:Na+/proline symporter